MDPIKLPWAVAEGTIIYAIDEEGDKCQIAQAVSPEVAQVMGASKDLQKSLYALYKLLVAMRGETSSSVAVDAREALRKSGIDPS